MEPQSQRLLEGLEGVLGVLPNPHITEVLSQGQATPGLSDAKGTKQQFATLRPQPPARAPRTTEAGSGPRRGHSPFPSAAPWCTCAAWSAGPRAAGAPDIAGGALLAQRRAAPTKDLLGRLVSAVGRAKPARGRRPEGLAPPPSGGLSGAHGGHRAQLGLARPRSRLSLGLSLPAGPAESGAHAPPLPRPYSGAGVSRLPSSSPSPEPYQTAGHCPLPPGPGLTLLLSRSLGEGWTPGSRGQRRQPVPATCPFLLANPNWCTPPTVKPDKPRVGVSTEKGFLQRRTRRLMLKRLQLPGGFQVFLKQGEEESHRVCADQLWDKSLIG